MTWAEEQAKAENLENYQNYLITKELKGKMSLSLEAVIALINSKRKVRLK